MARYLIVANQTLGGSSLEKAVRDCLSREPCEFYVVAPQTKVEHEATGWTAGVQLEAAMTSPSVVDDGLEEATRTLEARHEQARERAHRRLDQLITKIRAAGGVAQGEVGSDDPVAATTTVLEHQTGFDGIIVSTLPARLSRWLQLDVVSRISRSTDLPVTVVEADTHS